ncbi:MAG: TetR/AcrR family transcriptional regulator [Pseudomonadota bacterium]
MALTEAPLGRREKRKQEVRSRIESAAYALFQRGGIDDTSIEQICVEADVARRTFYGHFPNKHALLGRLGMSRLYDRLQPMLRELLSNHPSTRGRLEAMIDYIESSFAGMNDIDRALIVLAPSALASDYEEQRQMGSAALQSFTDLFSTGVELGDVNTDFSPQIMAAMVVGTLNMLTVTWAADSEFPVFAKLEEARAMFEQVICKNSV